MASWYDIIVAEEEQKTDRCVRMTASEWKEEQKRIIRSWTGDLRHCINHLDEMDARRAAAAHVPTAQPVVPLTEDELNWRVWKDMVEEPWKYGSDIGEWIELDEEVRRGPKRWRADAVWWEKVREIQEQEAAAATKIQALWRGHNLRFVMGPRFTCSHCLKHGVCPTEGVDGLTWFCAECTGEIWGEHETGDDEVCDDCGDEMAMYGAKVGELSLCPECIHDWTTCTRCDNAVRYGDRCWRHCIECGDDAQEDCFCSGDCRTAFLKDSWRD